MFPYFFKPKLNNPNPERPAGQPTTIRSLVNDFPTKPIPLPVWLWNILGIAIYLGVIVFVLRIATVILFGIPAVFLG